MDLKKSREFLLFVKKTEETYDKSQKRCIAQKKEYVLHYQIKSAFCLIPEWKPHWLVNFQNY